MKRILLILITLIIFWSCKSNKQILEKNTIIKNDSINLYAFIGKKISYSYAKQDDIKRWEEFDSIRGITVKYESSNFNTKYDAKYKIEQNIFNDLNSKTIEFIVYDHASWPPMDAFKYVVLYISLNKENGFYYLHKYQYQPVKKTKNGTWIGTNGKTIEELFNQKKNLISKNRILFKTETTN